MQSKVFGIGLPKTGTTSLYAALYYLGYRAGTYRHMARLGMGEWFHGDFTKDYFQDYDALTDLPLPVFYKGLYARYPGSKFILTVRPISTWLQSCKRQFSIPSPHEFSRKGRVAIFGAELPDENLLLQAYNSHYESVLEFFADKPDSLLIFNAFDGDSWHKLCPFLGKKIPQYQFPNVKPGFQAHLNPPETA